MFTTLFTNRAMMQAASKELQLISQGVSNLNTVGYKGQETNFVSLFESAGGGGGVTVSNGLNLKAGNANITGRPLDAMIVGDSFFVIKEKDGSLSYTRDGRFEFRDNVLMAANGGGQVMGLDSSGALAPITQNKLPAAAFKPSTKITFGDRNNLDTLQKNLSRNVTVFDSAGNPHTLTMTFVNNARNQTTDEIIPGAANTWTVSVREDATVLTPSAPADATIRFATNGSAVPNNGSTSATTISFAFAPSGAAATTLVMDLSNVLGVSSGSSSGTSNGTTPLAAATDGWARGLASAAAIGEEGAVTITLTNGKEDASQTLALARIPPTQLRSTNGVTFKVAAHGQVSYGSAKGGLDRLQAGALEGSNVDLTEAFAKIIAAQRVYTTGGQLNKVASELMDALLQMNR